MQIIWIYIYLTFLFVLFFFSLYISFLVTYFYFFLQYYYYYYFHLYLFFNFFFAFVFIFNIIITFWIIISSPFLNNLITFYIENFHISLFSFQIIPNCIYDFSHKFFSFFFIYSFFFLSYIELVNASLYMNTFFPT